VVAIRINKAKGIWEDDRILNIIYDDVDKDRMVGTLDTKSKVYTKKVSRSQHLYRKSHGFGLSNDVYQILIRYNCKYIKVIDDEDNEYVWPIDRHEGTYTNNKDRQLIYPISLSL